MPDMETEVDLTLTRGEIMTIWVALSNYILRMRQFINEFETSYKVELGHYESLKEKLHAAYESTDTGN
jgi:hypothetical protein